MGHLFLQLNAVKIKYHLPARILGVAMGGHILKSIDLNTGAKPLSRNGFVPKEWLQIKYFLMTADTLYYN